jgi:Rrf2 family iron-sulfur cluster assembly transcriptional regulator
VHNSSGAQANAPSSGGKVHSVYEDGTQVLAGQQPPRLGAAKPTPGAEGSHTQLRWDTKNNRVYQGREFDSNGNPVRLQEISTRQSISLHYLEQLFRKLRTGKVVKSVRGPGGGYVLSRSMDEISMKDVLDCVGENINPARDILGIPSSGIEIMKDEAGNEINAVVDTREFNLTKSYFENLGTIMQDYLATTTLGDLMRKSKGAEAFNNDVAVNTSAIRTNVGEVNQ